MNPPPTPPSLVPPPPPCSPNPSHGRRFPKNNMRKKPETGACVDSGRQCGARKSHPHPTTTPPHPLAITGHWPELVSGRENDIT